jgi:hypothetical protein
MKYTLTFDTNKHELTPIRLRGDRKAYLVIPMDFYAEDVEAIKEWLTLYVTPRLLPAPSDMPKGERE